MFRRVPPHLGGGEGHRIFFEKMTHEQGARNEGK